MAKIAPPRSHQRLDGSFQIPPVDQSHHLHSIFQQPKEQPVITPNALPRYVRARIQSPRTGEPSRLSSRNLPQRHHDIPRDVTRHAPWLSDHLRSSTGEPVPVSPIVALPGWYVKRKEQNGVPVLSGNEVPKYFRQLPARLPPEQLSRVRHQLDHLCRDVEA